MARAGTAQLVEQRIRMRRQFRNDYLREIVPAPFGTLYLERYSRAVHDEVGGCCDALSTVPNVEAADAAEMKELIEPATSRSP